MNLPPIEDRMQQVLEQAASLVRPCKACGAQLYFVLHQKSGKLTPYTKDGTNHFVNCPGAKEFKLAKAAEAE